MEQNWQISLSKLSVAKVTLCCYADLIRDILANLDKCYASKQRQELQTSLLEATRNIRILIRQVELISERCEKEKNSVIAECSDLSKRIHSIIESAAKIVNKAILLCS